MNFRIIRYLSLLLIAVANQAHSSDWVVVFETEDQLMEFDRSSIQPSGEYKFVRERVTFKKSKDYGIENGTLIKYMTIGALFSCKDRTETLSLVFKYSVDRKLVSKHEMKGVVERSRPGSVSETILKQVCTDRELGGK
jgi:hypothetical protein